MNIYDLRQEQTNPAPRSFVKNGKTVERDNVKIDSIVLHQTGIVYGVNEKQLRESDGIPQWALARRFLATPYHFIICPEQEMLVYHSPPTYYLQHANTLNSRSIGVSIHGKYTFEDTGQLNQKSRKIIRDALDHIMEILHTYDIYPEFVFAHRQSSAMRPSDPGEEIYKVCVNHLISRHNLLVQYEHRENGGKSIPDSWRV